MDNNKRFKAGYIAYLAGKGFYSNPYDRIGMPDDARQWWDGWEMAKKDDEDMHGPEYNTENKY